MWMKFMLKVSLSCAVVKNDSLPIYQKWYAQMSFTNFPNNKLNRPWDFSASCWCFQITSPFIFQPKPIEIQRKKKLFIMLRSWFLYIIFYLTPFTFSGSTFHLLRTDSSTYFFSAFFLSQKKRKKKWKR